MSATASSNRLYCPIIFKYAARLAQLSWPEFISDPVETTDALRNAQAALGADLIVNWFDDWSECELLGALVERDPAGCVVAHSSAPAPAQALAILKAELKPKLVDVASRLHARKRVGTLLAGFVTGPRTLTGRMLGPADETLEIAVQWTVEMLRSYGEIGLDFTIVAEDAPDVDQFYGTHRRALAPAANLSRYYRHPLVVLNRARADEPGTDILSGGAPPLATLAKIPAEAFSNTAEDLARCAASMIGASSPRRTMLLSSWEVPADAQPERVLELGRLWKGHA